MQKNWYMIYTKANCEKKVSGLLRKNNIEYLNVTNCRQVKHIRKIKLLYEPLFARRIFANLCEKDLLHLKEFKNVVNVVYWLDKPYIIKEEEINAIREFSKLHYNITLEKTSLNCGEDPEIINKSSFIINGNLVSVKNDFVTVNLPSLGFRMKAECKRETAEDHSFIISSQRVMTGLKENSKSNFQN